MTEAPNRTAISFPISDFFEKKFRGAKRIWFDRGGSSSNKTGTTLQLAIIWLITGVYRGEITDKGIQPIAGDINEKDTGVLESGVFQIARKYKTSLATSVQRDFENLLGMYELMDEIEINKTNRRYTFTEVLNGKEHKRIIEFIGMEDEARLKGGRRDFLYINEATEATLQEFMQLNIRTNYRLFLDFNPNVEQHWLRSEIEEKRAITKGDVDVCITTYKDNPYLPKSVREELENLKNTDPIAYKVYCLGEYGIRKGLVFPEWDIVPEIPEEARFLGYGLDFGFSQSFSALVGLYEYEDAIIYDEVIYQRGLITQELAAAMDRQGVSNQSLIIADHASPNTIEELRRVHNFNIKPCAKGKDGKQRQVGAMRSKKILITAQSENIKKEIRIYAYAEDKEGQVTNEPKKNGKDHAMDAMLYAADHFLVEGLGGDEFFDDSTDEDYIDHAGY